MRRALRGAARRSEAAFDLARWSAWHGAALSRIDPKRFPAFDRFAAPPGPRKPMDPDAAAAALATFAARCRAVDAARSRR
ncbi:hypothetical protein ACQ5SO_17255 [Rhodovulum sp. DZ06]|uniref:hypothetical protein n=1 Tax=Rhodovulum sp. DZ06 TaxID=3425126 RepID=UPI003D3333D3